MAVIHESQLSPISKNPCIQKYNTVRKDRSHGQGGGLLIFIHISITFSKQPSSPESLSNPHMEELSIKAELGNTKLIISYVLLKIASHHIPTGCHRHHVEPVPAEILDVMNRRDDLRKRDLT